MEKYVAKCENQNFVSKLSLWSLFCFLKFGFMSSLSIIFCISKLSRIAKIELKMQLPSVPKKKKHLNFVDMENSLCTNSSFINSVQNVQSRFLIQLKFKPCIFLFFLTPIFILCAIFWVFLLKTGVLVHNFWIYTYIRKSECI